jgi:HK97 family phage prohead protease
MSEPEVLRREVSLRVAEEGDGRTLEALLVPYNKTATVSDGGESYEERFIPGAFKAQMGAAHRIKAFLNFRHRQSMADVIGHATSIEDHDDGLHGTLRVLEVSDGDKALALIRAGVLDRLSIEFVPKKSRVVGGVVERVAARLIGVALVPEGAYDTAQILAVREPADEDEEAKPKIPEWARPKNLDPDLAVAVSKYADVPNRFLPLPNEPVHDEDVANTTE